MNLKEIWSSIASGCMVAGILISIAEYRRPLWDPSKLYMGVRYRVSDLGSGTRKLIAYQEGWGEPDLEYLLFDNVSDTELLGNLAPKEGNGNNRRFCFLAYTSAPVDIKNKKDPEAFAYGRFFAGDIGCDNKVDYVAFAAIVFRESGEQSGILRFSESEVKPVDLFRRFHRDIKEQRARLYINKIAEREGIRIK